MACLEFWYDFASPYAYLSAMRIEALALGRAVEIVWRPFLLGPLFAEQGWTTSPFNLYPAKGRYMVRDVSRLARARGIPFAMPSLFPARSLLGARVALAAAEQGWIAPLTRAVFTAGFGRGDDIADRRVMTAAIRSAFPEAEPDAVLERASEPDIKERLRAQTARARSLDIFGAPSFVTGNGELFWGDDRLEMALDWKDTCEQSFIT